MEDEYYKFAMKNLYNYNSNFGFLHNILSYYFRSHREFHKNVNIWNLKLFNLLKKCT